jgi:DNA gyrase/topoisomerase IV subunit B
MEIEVLTWSEALRRRPTQYLGELGREGLLEDLIFEALCHAVDEAINGNCTRIQIRLKTNEVAVKYDAGLPLDINPKSQKLIADILLTELLACHNLKKHIEIGSKYCHFGLAILNALCSKFQVDTVCNGQHGTQTYHKGEAKQGFSISDSSDINQTQFHFTLDRELLGLHEIDTRRLRTKAEELMQDIAVKVQVT